VRDFVCSFGSLLWGLGCAVLGICCEGTAHGLRHASYVLMQWADSLWEKAFQIGVWD
jgi:hypothetical protein